MCEQCMTRAEYYGDPVPGVGLVRATKDGHYMKKGQWGLVFVNDPPFVWSQTPTREPGMGAQDVHAIDAWYEGVEEFEKEIMSRPRMEEVWALVGSCIGAGFEPKTGPHFRVWLFDRLAKYLEWAKAQPFDGE